MSVPGGRERIKLLRLAVFVDILVHVRYLPRRFNECRGILRDVLSA